MLYPVIEPYESGWLDVGDGHELYWETVGKPDGVPVVYVHGGPGAGCTVGARRMFDPAVFRAVLVDQRGCGRSRPLADHPGADLTTNTTAHLVADLERLREHLGIERWAVAGLSWGVTLALVYAQRYPHRVSAMVLGAVTSGTRREIDWITRDVGRVFPQQWQLFAAAAQLGERDTDLAGAYAALLADPDPAVWETAAAAWCAWEDIHVSLLPGWAPDPRYRDPTFRSVFARLVTHYWSHDCFLAPRQIIADVERLHGIPAVLIHGRFDVSSPPDTAWELAQAWPDSRLVLVDDAGHGGGGFTPAVVGALDSIPHLLEGQESGTST